MLSQNQVDEIRQLLADGHSQRQIAMAIGVSRGTISAIATGKRPNYLPEVDDEFDFVQSGPLVRCPTCGGLTYLPCRLCHVRALKEAERQAARARRRRAQREALIAILRAQQLPRSA